MNRVPLWAKVVCGVGVGVGASTVLKEYLGGPSYESDVKLNGKVAIVTGANSGIGFEVAKDLARRGAKVYLACRDKDRCSEAREDIYIDTNNKDIHCRYCDLASFESVKRFSRRIQKDEEKIDLLVNNAGIMWAPQELSPDGIESHLAVNHLGHFLLTNLLIDKIKNGAPSRIVNVSSRAHFSGKINTKDLNSQEEYSKSGAYNQSKLANVLFTRELARKLEGTGVTVNAVHPGIVDTNIVRNNGFFTKAFMFLVFPFVWPFVKSPGQGARSVLHVALDPDLQETTGQYFNLQEIAEPSKDAQNDKLALWLWLTSEKWTNLEDAKKDLNIEPLTPPGQVNNANLPEIKQKAKTVAVKSVEEEVAGSLTANALPS